MNCVRIQRSTSLCIKVPDRLVVTLMNQTKETIENQTITFQTFKRQANLTNIMQQNLNILKETRYNFTDSEINANIRTREILWGSTELQNKI